MNIDFTNIKHYNYYLKEKLCQIVLLTVMQKLN